MSGGVVDKDKSERRRQNRPAELFPSCVYLLRCCSSSKPCRKYTAGSNESSGQVEQRAVRRRCYTNEATTKKRCDLFQKSTNAVTIDAPCLFQGAQSGIGTQATMWTVDDSRMINAGICVINTQMPQYGPTKWFLKLSPISCLYLAA